LKKFKPDGEGVVGIGEETNTGHDDDVPAEGGLVDFGESKSPSLIGIYPLLV
jgi:hypothetical protein